MNSNRPLISCGTDGLIVDSIEAVLMANFKLALIDPSEDKDMTPWYIMLLQTAQL